MDMKKLLGLSIVLTISVAAFSEESEKSQQSPPLPTHCVHGYSGVFTTPTAYMANPAAEGEFWGKPSVSATAAFLRHKDYQSYIVTENILGNIELGYAFERIGLGDWPSEVLQAGLPSIDDEVFVHNFNVRYNVLPEGSLDSDWMPAVTVGTHFKWNEGLSTINRQLGGACTLLGADHTFGTEFTVTASKTVTGVLPNPMILSAGIRNSDAIHTGLLGFAGERKTTFEGSIIYFLTEKLMVAAEYRQKSNLIDECTVGGKHLIKAENDWWDICLGYVVNDRMTIAGGYANFGNVLNTQEDNVWAFQVKYEF
jgi:hypothetical protein